MDKISAKRANLLVGNPPDSPLIEITLIGPEIVFKDNVNIAVCGAKISAKVNDLDLPMDQKIEIAGESTLSFGHCTKGCRSYLAVSGNLISGHHWISRRFENGETLKLERTLPTLKNPNIPEAVSFSSKILVIPGPEYDWIGQHEFEQLLNSPIRISPQSNRMAYLPEITLNVNNKNEIISSGVIPGTIQLPPSGKPIILMRDCQTIGGYPRIGVIPEVEMNRLAQIRPGDKTTFYKRNNAEW